MVYHSYRWYWSTTLIAGIGIGIAGIGIGTGIGRVVRCLPCLLVLVLVLVLGDDCRVVRCAYLASWYWSTTLIEYAVLMAPVLYKYACVSLLRWT